MFALPPLDRQRKGVYRLDFILSFLLSVAASVFAYYICKWLDREKWLAASLGFGVIFAAIFVFLFEGAIVLLAQFLAPILIDAVIAEITCVGSVIILALGFNLIGITKIKVTNYLPAIFFAPFIYWGLEKVMAAIA